MAGSSCEVNSREISEKHKKDEVKLLDMYSGCGAMSTGLCLGANLGGLNLVTVQYISIWLFHQSALIKCTSLCM